MRMMISRLRPMIAALTFVIAAACNPIFAQTPTTAASETIPNPPDAPREFRGVWVATVANIDWPSKPGLPSEEQRAEAVAILDRCVALKLNVVVLQVRTSCDALYASELEPWSYFLTGEQGKGPSPAYDPLTFWVDEAHARGLELHAWLNPFRAKASGQKYADAATHLSKTHPEWVKIYGNDKTKYLWLDPGEPAAREHSLAVFMDIVNRYDVDGIHMDDYFYPYPVEALPFPDDPAWNAYQKTGGKLERDDWRRDQINTFVRELYAQIKAAKPHVKFGISPFGIWKPGYPANVRGFSQYDKLYADAKLWLNEGWCDYFTPQLYWAITAPQQSFPSLLGWWASENTKHRLLVPGLFTSRVGDKARPYTPEQIESKIYVARYFPGSSGVIHFSMKALEENREGLTEKLMKGAYAKGALVPAMPWIDDKPPAAPKAVQMLAGEVAKADKAVNEIRWEPGEGEAVWKYVVYVFRHGDWSTEVLPVSTRSFDVPAHPAAIRAYAVTAVDRNGNESERVVINSAIPATQPAR